MLWKLRNHFDFSAELRWTQLYVSAASQPRVLVSAAHFPAFGACNNINNETSREAHLSYSSSIKAKKQQQKFASFSSVWVGVARKGLVICRYISRQPGKHFLDWLIVLRPLFPPPSISSGLSAGALIFCHKNQAGMFLFTSNQNLGNLFSQENLFLLICVKVPRKVVQYSLTRRSIYGVTIWDRVSCFISVE